MFINFIEGKQANTILYCNTITSQSDDRVIALISDWSAERSRGPGVELSMNKYLQRDSSVPPSNIPQGTCSQDGELAYTGSW